LPFRLTITKLSSLQRFILKAAYQNRRYRKKLARANWREVEPWRDLYNEEVAMLRFGVGTYAGPQPKFNVFGNKQPVVPFNRNLIRNRDRASKKLRDKFNASITRSMKRLEDRGLVERITQNHKDVFCSGCNLTDKGYKLAADLVAVTLGQCLPARRRRGDGAGRARGFPMLESTSARRTQRRERITPQTEQSSLNVLA
jgi:DNA-binding MarR family transcriptional regulator